MQARPTPGAPPKLVPSQPQSHQQYASARPGSPPPLLPSDGGRSQPRRQPGSPQRARGCPAAPPGRRRPPGRIKVRRAGRGGCSHRAAPNARPPRLHPGWAPPDTLRRRAGSVISVLPDPRGTRKYVGEKFPLPHGGRMSGERGRKMESSAGKMFLARGARTIRVPAGLVKNKLGGAGRAGFLRSDG